MTFANGVSVALDIPTHGNTGIAYGRAKKDGLGWAMYSDSDKHVANWSNASVVQITDATPRSVTTRTRTL